MRKENPIQLRKKLEEAKEDIDIRDKLLQIERSKIKKLLERNLWQRIINKRV